MVEGGYAGSSPVPSKNTYLDSQLLDSMRFESDDDEDDGEKRGTV